MYTIKTNKSSYYSAQPRTRPRQKLTPTCHAKQYECSNYDYLIKV